MSKSDQTFAALLTKAVWGIAVYEDKQVKVVQDEIGYALGKKGGTAVEYWRKGHIPANIANLETLTRELVKRHGLQKVGELQKFLESAGHPQPHSLLDQLTPWLDQKQITPATAPTPTLRRLSPFVVGPPITAPRQFFGRQDELKSIFDLWAHFPLQNVAVIGMRRSGKTSLLHHLKTITQTHPAELRPGQRYDWLPQPERYRWVLVDFQDVRMSSRETLLRYLLTNLKLPIPNPCDLHRFMDVVSEYLQTPTVILLDEISEGLASPELDRRFWNSLRSLETNYTGGNLAFLLAATEFPAQLARDEGKSSPFFNIFGHTLELGPFTEPEALELIANSPLPFTPTEVTWTLSQSRGWPLLLQTLCHARLAALEKGVVGEGWKEEGLRQIGPYRHLLGV